MKRILGMLLASLLVITAFADEPKLSVQPNPSSGIITLTYSSQKLENVKVEVFSVLGAKIKEQTFASSETRRGATLDLSGLPDGVFLIRVTQGDQSQVKRIKIQH